MLMETVITRKNQSRNGLIFFDKINYTWLSNERQQVLMRNNKRHTRYRTRVLSCVVQYDTLYVWGVGLVIVWIQ